MDNLSLADDLLKLAREQLERWCRTQDEATYRILCEKLWGTVAQAVMHISGKSISHHGDYYSVVQEIYEKTKNREFLAGFILGDKIHGGGFYHGKFKDEIQTYVERISDWLRLVQGM